MRLRAPRRKLRGHGLLHRIRHAAHDARRPVRKRDLPGRKASGRIDGNPRRGHHGHRSPGTRLGRAHRPRGDAAPPAVELRGPARTAPRRKGVGSGLLGIEPHPPARSGLLRRRLRHLVAGRLVRHGRAAALERRGDAVRRLPVERHDERQRRSRIAQRRNRHAHAPHGRNRLGGDRAGHPLGRIRRPDERTGEDQAQGGRPQPRGPLQGRPEEPAPLRRQGIRVGREGRPADDERPRTTSTPAPTRATRGRTTAA